ncbi:hypothetical protein D3C80_2144620 [compost metagenome]
MTSCLFRSILVIFEVTLIWRYASPPGLGLSGVARMMPASLVALGALISSSVFNTVATERFTWTLT